ncbi:kielin/chordin-like protein [Tachysurus ichikawai]
MRGCVYDGGVYDDNDVFVPRTNPCLTCVCSGGNVVCSSAPCPTPDCGLVETVSGDCCPRCRSCVHEGVQHEHGSTWHHPRDRCSVCTCSEGRVECSTEKCNTECRDTAHRDNCIPSCNRCSQNGQNFLNGDPVPSGGRCKQCVCENGVINCKPLPLPTPHCDHPIKRDEDCVQRSVQCDYESEVYSDGQHFTSKQNPCLTCQCLAGEVVCKNTESSCPSQHCTHPTRQHDTCCPTCNSCEFERRVYSNGEVFKPPGHGPCFECVCEGGSVRCHQERCPPVSCPNPVREPHDCCPVCKVCVLNGVEYEHGALWDSEDEDTPCTSCSCVEGNVKCWVKVCPRPSCTHPNTEPGECCPSCSHCIYNQHIYVNGQRILEPSEPCNICTCQVTISPVCKPNQLLLPAELLVCLTLAPTHV